MVRVFSLLNRMRKSSAANPFFCKIVVSGQDEKKIRESSRISLPSDSQVLRTCSAPPFGSRSLSESRARIVARLPFGSAWLIAIATAHAGQYPVGRKIHAEIKSSCKNSYIPSLLACAVAVAISHADPKGRRATQSARDSLSDRRERDSRRFADFFISSIPLTTQPNAEIFCRKSVFYDKDGGRKEIRKGIHYCHLP